MKLETSIKQKQFPNEYLKANVNILFTADWIKYTLADTLEGFELNQATYNILRILRGQYPNGLLARDIKDRMIYKSENLSSHLYSLESLGLIESLMDDIEMRLPIMQITEKGLARLTDCQPGIDSFINGLKSLDEEEVTQLNILLDIKSGVSF